ncbi:MAG: hypothetical protein HOI95_00195 [Chromatiales bacterium]|nr:hypothetical protein [Chromatiales bacterium]
MRAVATQEARSREVQRPDGVGYRHDYYGSPGIIDAEPQAFLVELPYAGATVKPHFHDIDQFQVIVAGDGRIGKKPLAPITFQYADAYTPYGPIVASENGISFFTLRNVASGGHFKMPGSKHLMPCRAGRNIAGSLSLEAPMPAAGEVVEEPLMDTQDDGVTAQAIRMGPGAVSAGMETDAGGQYYLVCAGALLEDGRELESNSLVRINAADGVTELNAGPQGAVVLALQFGRATERHGSDPALLAARDPSAYVVRKAT